MNLALALLACAAFFAVSLRLERRGSSAAVVYLLLASVIADAVFYADTDANRDASLFHPAVAGQNVRLTELLIPLALLARLIGRGLPRRTSSAVPLYAAFFAWMLVQTGVGLLRGYGGGIVLHQAAAVIYVGTMLFLAATVPAAEYVRGRALERLLLWSAVAAGVLYLLSVTQVRITSRAVPGLPLSGFGSFGADAATLFASLGVLGLVVEGGRASTARARLSVLVPSLVLVLSHLASTQRAARLGLYITLGLLAVTMLWASNRRRVAFRWGQVAGVVLLLGAALVVNTFATAVTAARQQQPVTLAVPSPADASLLFDTSRRQGSVDSRYIQWSVVGGLVLDNPILGYGLGKQFVHYEVGKRSMVKQDISHNLVLDIAFRMGLVGVLLAAAASAVALHDGLTTWRTSRDPRIAAFALAAATLFAGLLAKGMVESLFEKYRLAVLLGVLAGWCLAGRAAGGPTPAKPRPATAVPVGVRR